MSAIITDEFKEFFKVIGSLLAFVGIFIEAREVIRLTQRQREEVGRVSLSRQSTTS